MISSYWRAIKEKEQEEIESDPSARDRDVSKANAAAVSAAAKVKTIIPIYSSDRKENDKEYKSANVKEVASSLRIIIRIWERCLIAAYKAIKVLKSNKVSIKIAQL